MSIKTKSPTRAEIHLPAPLAPLAAAPPPSQAASLSDVNTRSRIPTPAPRPALRSFGHGCGSVAAAVIVGVTGHPNPSARPLRSAARGHSEVPAAVSTAPPWLAACAGNRWALRNPVTSEGEGPECRTLKWGRACEFLVC